MGSLLRLLAVCFLLGACAPTVQQALKPPAAFQGVRFDAEGNRFYSFDGAPLGLTVWKPADREPWAVVIGLHGMNDYAETFYLAGPWWAQQGIATYAYDARGQGRSPHRGVWGGTRLMTQDLRTAVALARRTHPGAVIAVVGESMGAATAIAAFSEEDAPHIDRLVLAAPAVWGWSTMPCTYAATLWVGAHMFPYRAVTPPKGVQRRITPSDNTEMLRKLGRDPNMIFTTRIDAVYGLVRLMERASHGAGAVAAHAARVEHAGRDHRGTIQAASHPGRRSLRPRGRSRLAAGFAAFGQDRRSPRI